MQLSFEPSVTSPLKFICSHFYLGIESQVAETHDTVEAITIILTRLVEDKIGLHGCLANIVAIVTLTQ